MRWSWPFTRKTHWEDMDDLTWLDYVLRGIRRVRSHDYGDEDEGMLICQLALHGHFTVELKVNSLHELIAKGRTYESDALVWKGRKRKWRLRWRLGR